MQALFYGEILNSKIKYFKEFIIIFTLFIIISSVLFHEKQYNNVTSKEIKRNYESQRIDLNKAGFEQLMSLPGIGAVKAKEIISYRQVHGNFNSIDDLINVTGIGPSTLEKIRDYLIVSKTNEVQVNENNEFKKININEANGKQLEKLPGIGPTKAKRIIEYREKNGKFKSLDELLNVNGIGPKTLKKIKNYLAF
ncbi:competence protein ComEA [Thermosipho japonicus]|uniref:Competence protein ComEA n=1 Tax=Thermosipho japonicus TaxID=90323 RepID=A0A841GM59_9BACT|nr:ComEA family DNA-binding protein [Thermosipho japonicus]MBB6063095.1 competence protein ComEA [Thermosipho japonicus]